MKVVKLISFYDVVKERILISISPCESCKKKIETNGYDSFIKGLQYKKHKEKFNAIKEYIIENNIRTIDNECKNNKEIMLLFDDNTAAYLKIDFFCSLIESVWNMEENIIKNNSGDFY